MLEVLVIAELDHGRVRRSTLSAITFAHSAIAAAGGGTYDILALGSDVEAAVRELARFGARRVLHADDPTLAVPLAERYAPVVASTVASIVGRDTLVVAAATSYGKDLLPRVAGRLDAAYAGDCIGVEAQGDQLVFVRPLFAGNAVGRCRLTTQHQVATARQSEFAPAKTTEQVSPIESVPVAAPGAAASRIEFVGFDRVENERPELTEARVVVAGGRGLKERFFEVLEPLADQLGAAIGATRAACDGGYAPGDYQVGQTGKVVAPDLYIAVGISGAIQHVAGMRGSKVIVAIDKDPQAPIFELADYGLLGDLFTLVPELTAALRTRKSSGNRP